MLDNKIFEVGGSPFVKVYKKPWKHWLEQKGHDTSHMKVDEMKDHYLAWKWGYSSMGSNRSREASWQQVLKEIKDLKESHGEIQDEALKYWAERNELFEKGCRKQWDELASPRQRYEDAYGKAQKQYTDYLK